jgi:CheY-like chemotaxis protein
MIEAAQKSAARQLGLRILVVEDEMMLVMLLEDILMELGCSVITAGRLAKAIEAAENETFDGAILDVNVAGEEVYPVAEALTRRSIPFIFSTGYGEGTVPAEYGDRLVLAKPYLPDSVEQALVNFQK